MASLKEDKIRAFIESLHRVYGISLEELYKDLHTAIYMLHYLNDEDFDKIEIRNVCSSLNHLIEGLQLLSDEPKG